MTEAEKLEEALKESSELLEGVQQIEDASSDQESIEENLEEPASIEDNQPTTFNEALLKSMREMPRFAKNAEVAYKRTRYKYLTLDSLLSTVKDVLLQNGIILEQKTDDGAYPPLSTDNLLITYIKVDTILTGYGETHMYSSHSHAIKCRFDENLNQVQGMAITYLQRYVLKALFALEIYDEDNDANDSSAHITRANNPTINAQQLRVLKGAIAETAQRTHRPIVEIERDVTQRGQVSSIEKLSAELFESAMAYIKGMS